MCYFGNCEMDSSPFSRGREGETDLLRGEETESSMELQGCKERKYLLCRNRYEYAEMGSRTPCLSPSPSSTSSSTTTSTSSSSSSSSSSSFSSRLNERFF